MAHSKVIPDTYASNGDYYRCQAPMFKHRDAWIMAFGPLSYINEELAMLVKCPTIGTIIQYLDAHPKELPDSGHLPAILALIAEDNLFKCLKVDEFSRRKTVEFYVRFIDVRIYDKLVPYAEKHQPLGKMFGWCKEHLTNLDLTKEEAGLRVDAIGALHPHFE